MLFRNIVHSLLAAAAVREVTALAITGDLNRHIKPYKRGQPLQSIVTWDAVSLPGPQIPSRTVVLKEAYPPQYSTLSTSMASAS